MKRILIVDDKDDNLYLLKVLLEGSGYEVECAGHGVEALQRARANPPALIIADILMPVMDGFALCREWTQDEQLAKIPFVFYTATYTDERDRQFGISLGAARFIVKPEEPDLLLKIIAETLEKAAQPSEPLIPGAPHHLPVEDPIARESQHLKQYNEALIRKVEAKMAELEQANRQLQRDLNARLEAEAALIESETRFSSLVDAAPEGIFIQAADRFVFVNQTMVRILGAANPAEILGQDLMSRIAPEYHELVRERISWQEQTGLASPLSEQEYLRMDGSSVAVETIAISVRYQGRAAHMVLVRDITERKRVEVFRRLSTSVLAIVNHGGDFHEIARQIVSAVKEATGCDAVGLRIRDGRDFTYYAQDGFPPDFLAAENSLTSEGGPAKPSGGEESRGLECLCGLVLSENGEYRNPCFTNCGTFWTNDILQANLFSKPELERCRVRQGCPSAGYRSLALVPICDRRQPLGLLQLCDKRGGSFNPDVIHILEEMASHIGVAYMRQQAEASLRANEARQRALIANIADVIAIVDDHCINRFKTPNVERWFGWKPEELVGQCTFDNVHPSDRQQIESQFALLIKTPGVSATGECRYRCKDGSYKWAEFTAVNLLQNPDIRGVLLNYHDITTRKRSEEQGERLQAQLNHAQKMESVGRLAGGVAHDFNNMLTVIRGNADLAMEQLPEASPLRENLEEIQKCAKRSSDLTRQLLAFARRQTIAPRILDLNDTVEGMLKMLRRLIGEDVELSWKPGAGLWSVNIDPSQVDQVLANLCVNAKDAITGEGTVILETRNETFDSDYCSTRDGYVPGDYVMLAVSDNGCGMPREVQEHIFEPFFTTKEVGAGTGLGLATVYGIVKQNLGFINVYSETGQGTVFRIYLPRHLEAADAVERRSDEALPRGTEAILLVEDEKSILDLGRKILSSLGYTVLATSFPAEAMEMARRHPGGVQLLMTDVVMPGMNGRELASRLTAAFPALKCLFMSGYTADVIAQRGVLKEGEQFLQKPFTLRGLAVAVRHALDSGPYGGRINVS
jgi:PAS domain S-box-containing protein